MEKVKSRAGGEATLDVCLSAAAGGNTTIAADALRRFGPEGLSRKAGATQGRYFLVEPVKNDRSLLTTRWVQSSSWSGRVIPDMPVQEARETRTAGRRYPALAVNVGFLHHSSLEPG